MKYKELESFYKEHFSIGNLGSNLETRLALIGLICYVVYKTKQKKPDVTFYQVITKLSERIGLTEDSIKALSIICEDFSYNCTEYPTFGLKGQEIVEKIHELLSNWMPF